MADFKFPEIEPGYDENGFPLEEPKSPETPINSSDDSSPSAELQGQDRLPVLKSKKGVRGKKYDRSFVYLPGEPNENGRPTINVREITPSGDIYDSGTVPFVSSSQPILTDEGGHIHAAQPYHYIAKAGNAIAKGILGVPGFMANLIEENIPLDRQGLINSLTPPSLRKETPEEQRKHYMAYNLEKEVGENPTSYTQNEPLRKLAQGIGSVERGEVIPTEAREDYPEYLAHAPEANINFGDNVVDTAGQFIAPGGALKGLAKIKPLAKSLNILPYPKRYLAIDAALGGGAGTLETMADDSDDSRMAKLYRDLTIPLTVGGGYLGKSIISDQLLASPTVRAERALNETLKQPGAISNDVQEFAARPKNKLFGDVSPVFASDANKIEPLPIDFLSSDAKQALSPGLSRPSSIPLRNVLRERAGNFKNLLVRYGDAARGGTRQNLESESIAQTALKADKGIRSSRAEEAGVKAPYEKALGTALRDEDANRITNIIAGESDPSNLQYGKKLNRIVADFMEAQGGSNKPYPTFSTIGDVNSFIKYLDEEAPFTRARKTSDTALQKEKRYAYSDLANKLRSIISDPEKYPDFAKAKKDYAPIARETDLQIGRGIGRYAKPGGQQNIQGIVGDLYRNIEHPADADYVISNMAKDAARVKDGKFVNKLFAGKLDDTANKVFANQIDGKEGSYAPEVGKKMYETLYGTDRAAATTNALAKHSALSLGADMVNAEKFAKGFKEFNKYVNLLSPDLPSISGRSVQQAAESGFLGGLTNVLHDARKSLGEEAFYEKVNTYLSSKEGLNKLIRLSNLPDQESKARQIIDVINAARNYSSTKRPLRRQP